MTQCHYRRHACRAPRRNVARHQRHHTEHYSQQSERHRIRRGAYSQPKHWAQGFNPFESDELADLRAERAKTQYPYADMPLVVLTRGVSDEQGPDSKVFEKEHREDHVALAKLSRNGKLIVAEHSGHHIQLDEPELVVTAIREVVNAATQR